MKWCWICSNQGWGGEGDHDSDEHLLMVQQAYERVKEIHDFHADNKKHKEWLAKQPEWNPI